MNITELRIKNFRCFGDQETSINIVRLTTIIGSNSSGKTALIQALLKLFGLNSKDRVINKSDFHVPPNKKPDEVTEEQLLRIEAKIEFSELQIEGEGVKTVPSFFKQMMTGKPHEVPYLRIRLEAKWTQSVTPDGEIDPKLYYVVVPYGDEEKEDSLKPMSSNERALIQMIYVPAVREPSNQLKLASGTILWRLVKSIAWPEDTNKEIQKNILPLEQYLSSVDGLQEIRNEVKSAWNKYHRDPRYTDANILFNETSLESMLKNINVQFSPTEDITNYTIDKLGDGLRSLFYLSLVSTLLGIEQKIIKDETGKFLPQKIPAALTILAVEEPENHISPHLLGRVTKNLRDISETSNAQVLLTSHSPSIVKRINPEEIRHVKVSHTGEHVGTTSVSEIKLPSDSDLAIKYVKEAVKAYPELYFAQLVILGEGDSEELIIPRLMQVGNIALDDETISVVPLGGRFVNHFWRLLKQLDVPFVTLLDLDRERGTGGWSRIKYAFKQLIEIDVDVRELLTIGGTTHPKNILEEMHKRTLDDPSGPNSIAEMKMWIKKLESYNFFFSGPLDIDLLMLESFTDVYKSIPENGPEIPDKMRYPQEYNTVILNGVNATLKKDKNETKFGNTYSKEQKELMVWYNSLFLGRSKPSTHLEALAKIEPNDFMDKCPASLMNALNAVRTILDKSKK
ncbi:MULTISPECIES: ATP-dependent nuclease [unclassified Paenibacillus]|uniref:ATP-dependent nuclease n=1 Tax=unclassified Paenibacillus TaxID=185978 RepID=UPI00041ED1F2|nr:MULTISPECIES: AAA family ATPase [unclassified Paenibacillus]KGP81714.1 DNA helicase [Paenibacillus sp. MAEPY2]KGP89050.1 DNA helicase [Paenibacillus sp. MAEPY1]